MPKDRLELDFETFSRVDLTKVGTSRYARDPSTEILMAAYSLNNSPIRQWIPAEGQDIPAELSEALVDPEVEKWAWNAPFEMNITRHKLAPVDVRQWRCAMVLGLTCSLPASLEDAGRIVGVGDDAKKATKGKALMRKFSFPRKPSKRDARTRVYWHEALDDWNEYLDYNRQDVIAEKAITRRLRKFGPPQHEWDLWHLDQIINERGLPINMDMVHNAIRVYEDIMAQHEARLRELTGLENPNSPAQLLPWLRENGYPFNDVKKGHIKRAKDRIWDKINETNDPVDFEENKALLEVLGLRLEVARTSISKYYALERATDGDGNLRYCLQFAAAGRTWRWGGRLFQPQNLPRPEKALEKRIEVHARNVEFLDAEALHLIYGNVMDLLASTIRPAAQAPKGKLFFDADLAAIENIVLGWLSRCEKILTVFERGADPYIAFAVYLFNRSYMDLWNEYKSGNTARRTISKPGVLGCGYMMSAGTEYFDHETGEWEATGLLGYAWNMGIRQFTKEDAALSVAIFRREYAEVKSYWYAIEKAAIKCVRQQKTVEFDQIRFEYQAPFMRIRLPSGRYLNYLRPKVEQVMAPWGEYKSSLTYEGKDDKKVWGRISTHPGKLTENVDQAIARDILAHALMEADRRGLDVRLHVHDQILGVADEDKAEEHLAILNECMKTPPKWAEDMPLNTAGFTTKVFMKD